VCQKKRIVGGRQTEKKAGQGGRPEINGTKLERKFSKVPKGNSTVIRGTKGQGTGRGGKASTYIVDRRLLLMEKRPSKVEKRQKGGDAGSP